MDSESHIPINPSELRTTLERIVSGAATAEDRQSVRQAMLGGQIVFTAGESSVAAGEKIEGSIVVSGKDNHINILLNEATYYAVQERLLPQPAGIAPPLPLLLFIGRESAMTDVKKLIGIGRKSAAGGSMTVVRGWPGVGKTTLVGVLSRDEDTAKAFPDGVLWTSLDEKPNLLSEIAAWGRALGIDGLLRVPTTEEATAQLRLALSRKKMLLIVDDVWDVKHAVPFKQVCGETNTLLITTRETLNVAEELVSAFKASIYKLPELTEDDAFKLLSVLAPTVVKKHPAKCRELVVALECLPLSLHVAGSLLHKEAKMGWGVENLLEDIKKGDAILKAKTPADRKEATVSALLHKSTDLLSEEGRECFAFLGPFAPKPATFDLGALKAMWQIEDPRPVVMELVGHGLMEPVGRGRFQMHALLVAHALSMLEN